MAAHPHGTGRRQVHEIAAIEPVTLNRSTRLHYPFGINGLPRVNGEWA